jgi:hypothetical protein
MMNKERPLSDHLEEIRIDPVDRSEAGRDDTVEGLILQVVAG